MKWQGAPVLSRQEAIEAYQRTSANYYARAVEALSSGLTERAKDMQELAEFASERAVSGLCFLTTTKRVIP